MAVFCSAKDFHALCLAMADRADILRLQAKGGSMYPFIKSGDWVEVELCKGTKDDIKKGDIVLFEKSESLYLHRVLRKSGSGLLVKGDMSFGHDGIIPVDDVMARAVSIRSGARRRDLRTGMNRRIGSLAADLSLILQYPVLLSRKVCAIGMAALSRIQALKLYRIMIKMIMGGEISVSCAMPEDEEELRDLYLMSGRDIRDGMAGIRSEGFWLVARRRRKVAGALTVSRYEKDASLWLIFGLEVKPYYRGMGAARNMVQEAMLKAKEAGAARIGLFVNKKSRPALGLYGALGFHVTDDFPSDLNRSSDELYLSHKIHD